jgi:hypothetical protein
MVRYFVARVLFCLFYSLSAFVSLGCLEARAVDADLSSPYRADFTLERVYQVAASKGNSAEVQSVPTVRLQGRIRGVGFVDARFNVRRNKVWKASMRRNGREFSDEVSPVLLQGKLAAGGAYRESGRRIYPVAASIIGKELKVSFPGRARGSDGSRQRVYTVKMTLDGSIVVRASVSSIPKSAGRRGACGAEVGSPPVSAQMAAAGITDPNASPEGESAIPPLVNGNQQPTALSKVVTISTDADPEWYAKYGEQSNAVIASLINTAEALYSRQLGLRFRIVKQHVYTNGSPYSSTEPGTLLGLFTRNPDNATNLSYDPNTFHQEVDLKHLFTGKDLDGTVIGIAYIGVVCAVPSLSYGITQSYLEAANAGIFAHELGHNFGANHDTSVRDGLMYPSISIPPAERLSDFSLGEVNQHLSRYGSCISLEQVVPRPDVPNAPLPPAPTPTIDSATLTLRRMRVGRDDDPVVRLSGSLVSSLGTGMGAVGIKLMVSGEEAGRSVTAGDGSFEFFVKFDLPRGRRVYVYVETEGGEVFSNFLWMSRTAPRNQRPTMRARRAR